MNISTSYVQIPSLRVLDYRRVKQAEKVAAKRIFGGTSGTKLLKEMENTFVPGEELDNQISARYIVIFCLLN